MAGPGRAAMFVARSIAADHRDLIHDVSFDFHGRRMATCSSDQSVKVSGGPGPGAARSFSLTAAGPRGEAGGGRRGRGSFRGLGTKGI